MASFGFDVGGQGRTETNIYFENKTGSSVTLQTILSGTPLRRDAYQIGARMILLCQTLKAMSMNRDSGIKNGKLINLPLKSEWAKDRILSL